MNRYVILENDLGVVYDDNKTYYAFRWQPQTLENSLKKAYKRLEHRQQIRKELNERTT